VAGNRASNGRRVLGTKMMFERFTEKAIKVVMLAQEEARRLGHNFVGTEQILLGLIGESTGTCFVWSLALRVFCVFPYFEGRAGRSFVRPRLVVGTQNQRTKKEPRDHFNRSSSPALSRMPRVPWMPLIVENCLLTARVS